MNQLVKNGSMLKESLAQPHSERYYRRKDGMIKLIQTYYNGFEFGKQTIKYYHEDRPSFFAQAP